MGLILDFDIAWIILGLILYCIFLVICKLCRIQLKMNRIIVGIFIAYIITLFMACFCPFPVNKAALEGIRFMYEGTQGKYVSLIPFQSLIQNIIDLEGNVRAIVKEMISNCILFIPFGFLYNYIFHRNYSFKQIAIRGFLLSLSIESLQLCYSLWIGYPIRYFDVNDLIMNTLGTMIGYLCWYCLEQVEKKKR